MSAPIDTDIRNKLGELFSLITPQSSRVIGELILLLAIKTMVDLKRPRKILLVYHSHCGAADTIDLDEFDVRTKLQAWCDKLKSYYPTTEVRLLRETHSECGEHHHGHEEVCVTMKETLAA